MKIEFRKVKVPEEIEALCEFDRKAFASFPGDIFDPEDWAGYESYWMTVDEGIVGCSAFVHRVDHDQQYKSKSLYMISTGVLPEFQGRGLGAKQKQWQIEYARQGGFEFIVTNMRESNVRIIRLNEQFGFKIRETVLGYYSDPEESAVVMELKLLAQLHSSQA